VRKNPRRAPRERGRGDNVIIIRHASLPACHSVAPRAIEPLRMSTRARIQEVAKAAGVSLKTVSRVLNNEPNVRGETRERVEAAAKALNYRPNPSARSLAGHRSFVVALLYDNPSNNYVMEILSGVLDACAEQRYHLVLQPLSFEHTDFAEAVDALVAHSRPDGVLLTPPLTDQPALLAELARAALPHASISPMDMAEVGVTLDEPAAVRELVAHLVALGHRRIAHVTGHPAHGARGWRLAGYREALQMAGLPYDPALVIEGEFSFDSGVAAARRLFALPQRPTAVFAANDDMAAGVIRAAYELGLDVPHDVSVCGFDDTPMSRQIFPALTTVRQPSREMGRVAALELLRSIRDRSAGRMLQSAYTLQLRDSTGPAPPG
jgi:LacI family transcriptional regulator